MATSGVQSALAGGRRALTGGRRALERARVASAPLAHGLARGGRWVGGRGRAAAEVGGPLARLLVARARPYVAVVSATGWALAALAAVALWVGFGLGWRELTYLGLTLVAALLVSAAFLIGRSTYAVGIDLNPSRVVVGGRAMGRLLVTNNGLRGVLASRMELPVGAGVAEFALPGMKPEQQHEELFAVPTHRRAVIVAGPAVSVRGDQLGILRRTVRWTDPVDLFVHPETTPLTPSAAGLVRDLEGQVTKKITNNDLSFHALRAYVPGDDRRYIHWRSSARTGELMVRQFEETRRSQLIMLHSENRDYYESDDEFELAVSVTASIGAQVVRDGTRIDVVSESRRLRTHSPVALLDDSCRFELTKSKYRDARAFARTVTARLAAPSVLMVIAGSQMTIADYRSIEALFPVDTTIMAFRVALGAAPSLRPVSRMRVATVGRLSELPAIMRRAGS